MPRTPRPVMRLERPREVVGTTPVEDERVRKRKADTSTLLPLAEYDRIMVAYSGGKDSLACLLYLRRGLLLARDRGAPPGKRGTKPLRRSRTAQGHIQYEARGSVACRARLDRGSGLVDHQPLVDFAASGLPARMEPRFLLGLYLRGPDQWASVQSIAPERFSRIVAYERLFGVTIDRKLSVVQMAAQGAAYPECADNDLRALALGYDYASENIVLSAGEEWELPAGAYRSCGGPT